MEWIRIEDKFPDEGIDVLVSNGHHVWTANLEKEYDPVNYNYNYYWHSPVSYSVEYGQAEDIPEEEYLFWMPMIKLPEKLKEQ